MFDILTKQKMKNEINIHNYENKNKKDKLYELDENLNKKINEIIKNEDSIYPGFLRTKSFEIIQIINENKDRYKKLINEENIVKSNQNFESDDNDKFIDKLIEYMLYKKSQKELDYVNLELERKNLVLI